MMMSNPAILTYAIDNIRDKIKTLRDLGFNDPVKIIRLRPEILGVNIVRSSPICAI